MSALRPVLEIVLPAAAVGFGVGAVATVAARPRPRALPGGTACVDGAWAPPTAPAQTLADRVGPAGRETLAQFPSWPLTERAQRVAFEAALAYLEHVEEREDGEATILVLPAVQGSAIPEMLEIPVRTALERVQALTKVAGAIAMGPVAPTCELAPPFSDVVLTEAKTQQVQEAVEQVSVVALAERDGRPIAVDVDPASTVIEEEEEVCMPEGLVLPLRSPTMLAPEIGDDPDGAWPISQQAQVQAYEALLEALADPQQTAPISAVVQALAPECPWADKARYGLDMTTLWYATQRMAQIASADLASWGGQIP